MLATLGRRIQQNGDFLLAGGVLGLVLILLVPLPPVLLDVLLVVSIGVSLLLFLTTLSVKRPVDFSLFPSLLLVSTVLRLALNVASTRLVLLHGHEGTHAAGQIIQAFGQFVVGGNFAVGLVIFVILVIINFVVITKGAGRVAEVAARFTLDAMPGKQMAVDAELNAGLIDEATAKRRRAEVSKEADFYGSMDGASKFVRGDAIAGIVITVVNILGGIFIGVVQEGMTIADAGKVYTILTIGDGLVGQVPALIVSTAAGLLVTRVEDADETQLHQQFGLQVLKQPRVLAMVAGALALFAFVPGLTIPFLLASAAVGTFAYVMWRRPVEKAPVAEAKKGPAEVRPEDLLPVDPLTIEVGVDILYLVDDRQGAELVERIQRTRNQVAQEQGLVLPPVHVRDNLRLDGDEYVIQLRGETIARGKVQPRKHLALDPGSAKGTLKGVAVKDPVFGLPAFWIPDTGILKAQQQGYTVVDVPTVLTTHFVELMHSYGHELYDPSQLTKTLERIQETHPKLVDDLTPDPLPRHALLRIFRNLLKEGLSVRDAATVLEAIAETVGKTRDPDVITEFVRQRLARQITRRFADDQGTLHYVGFGPRAETALLQSLQTHEGGAPNLVLDPEMARQLFLQIQKITETWSGSSPAVVLCAPLARGALRRLTERVLPRVVVVSSAELLPSVQLDCVGTVEL